MKEDIGRKYTCINCENEVTQLYKKYSQSVLKLTKCNKCSLIADKYIEYDIIIIAIDLILLNREAYRHVLFNTSYPFQWKLTTITQLMEAYSDWMLFTFPYYKTDFDTKKPVVLDDYATGDLQYYKTIMKVLIRNVCFFLIVVFFTKLYNVFTNNRESIKDTCTKIWKCISLSSIGVFMFLPSLIWDTSNFHEYHFICVCLYTSLSQLIAYTVTCKCPKIWSIVVIVLSYCCKLFYFQIKT